MNKAVIARAAHEINRVYCAAIGDTTQTAWEDAPEWQKASAMAGVEMHLANPDATPEDSHASWLAQKEADGWKWGAVKNVEAKEHPCYLPYDDLPPEQKAKDYLFRATVHLVAGLQEAHALELAEVKSQAAQKAVVNLSASDVDKTRTTVAAAPAGYTLLAYTGHRATHKDNHFDSGLVFVQNVSRLVPTALAAKLLTLPGMFKEEVSTAEVVTETTATAADLPAVDLELKAEQAKQEKRQEEELEDARQSIGLMTKEVLTEYALRNFNVKLDAKAKVGDLRAQVTGLFDQFGAAA